MTWFISCDGRSAPAQFMSLAGTPTAVQPGGTEVSTTLLAPTREYSPISMLPNTFAPIDSRTPRRTLGWRSPPSLPVPPSVTPCMMETSSSTTAVSPMTTPVAWSIMMPRPMRAPGWMALFFQSRISELFDVDIHPGARMGRGIMIDHATGVVIGETAVVEDDVSIMHGVTLGGTGKEGGDRHPKVRRGVLLSMGAKVLGNIEIGEYSRVGASSVVLTSVPPGCTAVGVPARLINCAGAERPSQEMNQVIDETGGGI